MGTVLPFAEHKPLVIAETMGVAFNSRGRR